MPLLVAMPYSFISISDTSAESISAIFTETIAQCAPLSGSMSKSPYILIPGIIFIFFRKAFISIYSLAYMLSTPISSIAFIPAKSPAIPGPFKVPASSLVGSSIGWLSRKLSTPVPPLLTGFISALSPT